MSWSTPLTALPHLSDEAVAAFADGVLSGTARQRAQSHMAGCGECSDAVRGQRTASALLRSAPSPSLPADLLARLRELPITAELPATHFAAALSLDGQPLFASFGADAVLDDYRAPMTPAPPVPSNGMSTLGAPEMSTTGLPAPGPLGPPHSAWAEGHVLPVHRHASTRTGFGVAAAAALAVGVLASTAATAGGVTPSRSVTPISRVAPAGAPTTSSGPYQPAPAARVELSVLTFTTSSGK